MLPGAETWQAAAKAPGVRLTPRERQIVDLVVLGHANREIASRLGTTERTVKNQLYVLFDKVGVRSRLQLALWAIETQAAAK